MRHEWPSIRTLVTEMKLSWRTNRERAFITDETLAASCASNILCRFPDFGILVVLPENNPGNPGNSGKCSYGAAPNLHHFERWKNPSPLFLLLRHNCQQWSKIEPSLLVRVLYYQFSTLQFQDSPFSIRLHGSNRLCEQKAWCCCLCGMFDRKVGLVNGHVVFDSLTGRISSEFFGGHYDCYCSNHHQALLSETPPHWWCLSTPCGLMSLLRHGRDLHFISVDAPAWSISYWNCFTWTCIEWYRKGSTQKYPAKLLSPVFDDHICC